MSRRAISLTILVILAGCGQRPDPQLYVMSPAPAPVQQAAGEQVEAVLRVRVPDYLDRPQIVSRSGANELEISDTDRWAEPLSESIPRVLAENLSHALPGARVVVPQDAHGQKIRYEYLVALDAYEPDGNGSAIMRGHWQLRDNRNNKIVAEGRLDERRPLASDAASEVVAALNQNLNDASSQIAEATAPVIAR